MSRPKDKNAKGKIVAQDPRNSLAQNQGALPPGSADIRQRPPPPFSACAGLEAIVRRKAAGSMVLLALNWQKMGVSRTYWVQTSSMKTSIDLDEDLAAEVKEMVSITREK